MSHEEPEDYRKTAADFMKKEEQVREKIDENGLTWHKIYFGGGAHYRNWLDQAIEIFGEENIAVEEIRFSGLKCFEDGGEKAYRVWHKSTGKKNRTG